MRNSAWEIDLWSQYTIEDQTEPENWHKAKTMTFVGNAIWTIAELYDNNKRKHDAMSPPEEMATSENISEAAAIYNTAVEAMTPKADAMSASSAS